MHYANREEALQFSNDTCSAFAMDIAADRAKTAADILVAARCTLSEKKLMDLFASSQNKLSKRRGVQQYLKDLKNWGVDFAELDARIVAKANAALALKSWRVFTLAMLPCLPIQVSSLMRDMQITIYECIVACSRVGHALMPLRLVAGHADKHHPSRM